MNAEELLHPLKEIWLWSMTRMIPHAPLLSSAISDKMILRNLLRGASAFNP